MAPTGPRGANIAASWANLAPRCAYYRLYDPLPSSGPLARAVGRMPLNNESLWIDWWPCPNMGNEYPRQYPQVLSMALKWLRIKDLQYTNIRNIRNAIRKFKPFPQPLCNLMYLYPLGIQHLSLWKSPEISQADHGELLSAALWEQIIS